MNKEEEAFNKWAAYYFTWSDTIATEEEIKIAKDAFEAGFDYAFKTQSQSE